MAVVSQAGESSAPAPGSARGAARARRWGMIFAGIGGTVGWLWLALWLARIPALATLAASRCKTNAALSLAALGTGYFILSSGRERLRGLANALVGLAALIGALTLVEYVAHVDFGIDQLLATDVWSLESARFPNRMAPSAALGFVLLGAAGWLITRSKPTAIGFGQAAAFLAMSVGSIALIGYLYSASVLYRPLPYVRISPYTAAAIVSLALSALTLRHDAGPIAVLTSSGIGGFLARRLLPITLLLPLLVGWLLLDERQEELLSAAEGHALLVTAIALVMAPTVLFLAHSLDRVDRSRREAEGFLRSATELTSALSCARSVNEVVAATLDLGLPALGAQAGGFWRVSGDGRELSLLESRNYASLPEAYLRLSLDAELPVAHAVKHREAIFLGSIAERDRSFPRLAGFTDHAGLAVLPLEGNSGALGAITLSFAADQRFDATTRQRSRQLAWQCTQALERALLFDSEQQARERAEAASRAKDEFLAMLGHELRNPLSPILTSLHLMELRDPKSSVREREVIQRQVSHMVRLVDDLLDVSRIASGRIELRKRPVEVGPIVSRAVELTLPLLQQKRHQLVVDVRSQDLVVNADQERLVQVLANLLTNAAKYSPEGSLIALSAEHDGEAAMIRVEDNGMGISQELLPHVFDLFVQGKRTLERSEGGLGLGLALVRSLVQLHGGNVAAKSNGPGLGSEFVVRIPLAATTNVESTEPSVSRMLAATKTQRILLVDDNRDAADSMAQALAQAGHEVRVAYDGQSALELVGEFSPRLALLDIGLPVMDGYELAKKLREARPSSSLTLVAVTGYGQKTDRERSARAGFDSHWVKPVSIAELTRFVAGLN